MTPAPITREAVKARVAALRRSPGSMNEIDTAAEMLLALLARAEKGENFAQFYKVAFRRVKEGAKRRVESLNCRLDAALARAETAERERGYGDMLIADHLDTIRRRDEKVATLTADLAAAKENVETKQHWLDKYEAALKLHLNSEPTTDEAIASAIRETEYKYFGDYQLSEGQWDAIYTLVNAGRELVRMRTDLAAARKTIAGMREVENVFRSWDTQRDKFISQNGLWEKLLATLPTAHAQEIRAALAQANKTEGV